MTARPMPGLPGICKNCAEVVPECPNPTGATVQPGATFWPFPRDREGVSDYAKLLYNLPDLAEQLHRVALTPRLPKDLDKSRRRLGTESVLDHGATIYGCTTYELLHSVIRRLRLWGWA